MKTLIVYYSLTHTNELLAKEIFNRWAGDCDLYRIAETKPRSTFTTFLDNVFKRTPKIVTSDLPVGLFDNYVFIAPVWMGKVATPLKAFLLMNKKEIKQYSFITLCGGIDGQRDRLVGQLNQLIGHGAEVVTELRLDGLKENQITQIMKERSSVKLASFFKDQILDFVKNSEMVSSKEIITA